MLLTETLDETTRTTTSAALLRTRPHARAPDIENTSPPRFDAIMTEAPSALLERTNLAEYLRARKAIALENSQQGP